MMWDGWGWGGAYGTGVSIIGMTIMAIFWIAIVVGIVLLVIWLVRQAQGGHVTGTPPSGMGSGKSETPVDILKARYARGEIDKAEFEEKLKDLTS